MAQINKGDRVRVLCAWEDVKAGETGTFSGFDRGGGLMSLEVRLDDGRVRCLPLIGITKEDK